MAKRIVDLSSEEIHRLANEAWDAAARDTLAEGLPVTGSRDGRYIRLYPDGRVEDLGPVDPLPVDQQRKLQPKKKSRHSAV